MKCLAVALLVCWCSTGLVSSKSHHSLRSSEFYEDHQQCQADIELCGSSLKTKYPTLEQDPTGTFLQIRQNGARSACSDFLTAGGCVKKAMEQSACQSGTPEPIRVIMRKSWNLGNKLCVDRIDDFSKHWLCVLSYQAAMKMNKCESLISPVQPCDPSKIADCIAEVYASVPDCQTGSYQFIREFLPEILVIADVCPSQGHMNLERSLQKFLRI